MSTEKLSSLLIIRAFRRDEKERVMMNARNAVNKIIARKQACIAEQHQVAATLAAPYENLGENLTTKDITNIRVDIAMKKQRIAQLREEAQRLEQAKIKAEQQLVKAREDYMKAHKAYERLETLLSELQTEENRMAEIMEELNADDPIMKKPRRAKK